MDSGSNNQASSDSTFALRLDAGAAAAAAVRGDGVLIPIEAERRLVSHLSWQLDGAMAVGTGSSGTGLTAVRLDLGLRWYPFSRVPWTGFFIAPRLGGAWVYDALIKLGGPKLIADLLIGYAFVLASRWSICLAIDATPYGLGFPVDAFLLPQAAVGLVF